MKRIQIRGLRSIDNYGTAMMGLVTIEGLSRLVPGKVDFLCDFDATTDIGEIENELQLDKGRIRLARYEPPARLPATTFAGFSARLRRLLGDSSAADCDMLVMLGGDDVSEYYRPDIWRLVWQFWRRARTMPVVLLAQTIGPFNLPRNRLAAKYLMPALTIIARDKWTKAYLTSEFGLGKSVIQGSDLAYANLPLQGRADIEAETLARYGLEPESYATIVVSGMQAGGYYTKDRAVYLERWRQIAEAILALPAMQGRRLCLLAHTFGLYGDEGKNVAELHALLSPEAQARTNVVSDRILATRARFVLGNGLFTVTGRMHPAVSTFQMGKPAITLAYSKKYEGVIGTMIGRSDLIIDANIPELWSSGAIVDLVVEKARDTLARHPALCAEIRAAVAEQKGIVEGSLVKVAGLLGKA